MSEKKHSEYQYLDLLADILENGSEKKDHNTGTSLYSVFGRQMRFELEGERVPVLTTKKVYLKGVIHELVWFLRGMTNIRYLVQNNVNIWNDYPYKVYKKKMESGEVPELSFEEFIQNIKDDEGFANEHGDLAMVYGKMWRAWPAEGRTIDQLNWAIENIKNFPHRKSTVVSAWNPEYLYSMALPGKALSYPLCHILYHFNVVNGKLSMLLYQRSADMFLGVPFNIASYSILLKIVAHLTGYEPGEFVHTLGDAHLYGNHVEQAKEQMSREPMEYPEITIDPSLTSLDELTYEHIIVHDYKSHPAIKGEMTVAGGFNEKDRK
jgi:thymidylate synthase